MSKYYLSPLEARTISWFAKLAAEVDKSLGPEHSHHPFASYIESIRREAERGQDFVLFYYGPIIPLQMRRGIEVICVALQRMGYTVEGKFGAPPTEDTPWCPVFKRFDIDPALAERFEQHRGDTFVLKVSWGVYPP